MAKKRLDPHEAAVKVGEALGLGHLLVTNAIVLIGEFTPTFLHYGAKHGGVEFVMLNIDSLVFSVLGGSMRSMNDALIYFLWVELILVVTSFLYACACYFVTRFIFTIYKP